MKTSGITLTLLMQALLHVLGRVLGDFSMSVRRVGTVCTIELTEAGADVPTLVTTLNAPAPPAREPVQLPIPGTETSTAPAARPSTPPDAAPEAAPAADAATPPRPPYSDACLTEHLRVGYRYGFSVAELNALGREAQVELTMQTGLTIEPSEGDVRWTSPTTERGAELRLQLWATRHGLRVYVDPDDPRPRVLVIASDDWKRHHQGLMATTYGWGHEGSDGCLRVAIVPPGRDLERILAYAQEKGLAITERIADDGQQPSAPEADELPDAPPRGRRAKPAAKPTAKPARASDQTSSTTVPATPKPHRRIAVPEADELAQGASDHRAVGLVHGTWQTVMTRTAKQTATEWSEAVKARVNAGVRTRVYDRAGRCMYDSADGGWM